MEEADPVVTHSLKRLQGALVMMGTIFAKLGNLMKSALPKLLQILLCMCAHTTGLMEKRSAIDPKFLAQLKNLRTLCLERITQFFAKFEFYPWTTSEVEALFHVCVWPQLFPICSQGQ
jgi:U3 small nucleolar RNA-associated protein 20